MWTVSGYFYLCENERFSLVFRFQTRGTCHMRSGADRGNILGQPMPFVCMGICVLSPAHESEMRGYLVYVLIVKKISY